MIKRPTTQEPECLEPTSDQHHSSLRLPKRASRIFGQRFSFSSDSSRFSASLSSIQTARRPSTGLKDTPSASPSTSPETPKPPVSPTHGVISIINSMYANPISRGRVDSHPARHSSLHLNGHGGGSISIRAHARSSTDSNSQKSKGTIQVSFASPRKYPSFDSSMNAKPQETRSASISSRSTGSSKSKRNASTSSQDSGSSLRVVGRGGSGSKLRIVAPQAEGLDPAAVRQDHPPPLIRPSGRGGHASRPKPLDAPLVTPKINPKPPTESGQPSFIRPSGRGGLASRPKPIGSPSSPLLFKLLKTKSKNGIDKGKRKALEPIRAIHPLPPNLTYQISNGSTATLSTIHFIDETGEPSTPFFPDDRSMIAWGSAEAISSPLSGSSMYTTDRSSSQSSILSDQTAETTEEFGDEDLSTKPIDHRERNLVKLARTLGYSPDDAALATRRSTDANTAAPSLQKKNRNAKVFRRASISVTSLASMFGKPGTAGRSGRDSVATSMMTDDLHHFGLEDDLSDSWGTTSSSSFCERAASPIVFSPPSPAHERNPKPGPLASCTGAPVCRENSESSPSNAKSEDTLSVSSSALTCSEYNVFTPSQRPSTTASSHSRQYSIGSILPDLSAESNKSVWLVPVKDDDEFDILPQRYRPTTETTLGVKKVSEKSGHWSGEWNEDIHEVIRSLRRL